jgi:predicted site-specific integrase-resolvase
MSELKPAEAARQLGVSTQTLRNWTKLGRISCTYTAGGNARYPLSDIVAFGSGTNRDDGERRAYIYARVSSAKQKADLQRQIDFLQGKFPNHAVISDVGSGVNFSR